MLQLREFLKGGGVAKASLFICLKNLFVTGPPEFSEVSYTDFFKLLFIYFALFFFLKCDIVQ